MRIFPETSFGQEDLIGFWSVLDTRVNVAIGIMFKADTDSLLKMLPEFITKLKVPLTAIAEVTADKQPKLLLFKNQRDSSVAPYFDANWVFNSGYGHLKNQKLLTPGNSSD
jgi:hypothetical protein